MARVIAFNSMSLDGYFCGEGGDISWAHSKDPEWDLFVEGNAKGGGVLLFGRVTYDLMAAFWPTPIAAQMMPVVAERMNCLPKIVFSRNMVEPAWNNTKVAKDAVAEVRRLRQGDGAGMAIMGSGSIISQLAREGLIDEYQVVVRPVILGKGRTMFEGIPERLPLKQIRTRNFANGNTLLCYEPQG